jgi:Tfp pilus assembly protein PilF
LQDTLQLQTDVANDIAQQISAKVGHSNSVRPSHPLNPTAYDDYLKGRNLVRRMDNDDIVKALDLLNRSIQEDPDYAPAYAEKSLAYQVLAWLGHWAPNEVLPKSKTAALKAVELDENLAEAHAVLGTIYGEYEWDWAGDEKELRRAVELNPSLALAHTLYAEYFVRMRKKPEAIQEINTALELDPYSPMNRAFAAFNLLGADETDQGVREARRAVEIDNSFAGGHLILATALGAAGQFQEAFPEWLRYLESDGEGELAHDLQSAAAKNSGTGDPGQRLAQITIRYYQQKARTRYVSALTMALAYIDRGDCEKVLQWLERAYEERSNGLTTISIMPNTVSLRSDPRFRDLLRRMNLPMT